jgi:hypothetical protein
MMGIIIGIIVIIIIAVIVVSLTAGRTLSYAKIENKLETAASNYCEDNDDKLPKKVGDEVIIETSTLVSGGYIKDLSEYTDENVSCNANVIVGKTQSGYDYVAALDCGNDYKTSFFVDKLKENIVTSGNGLYQLTPPSESLGLDESGYDLSSNELLTGYAYRGENVNNYIKIGKDEYRIVKIDGNGDIMIVTTKTKLKGPFDNRYNISTDKNSGINDYSVSRAYESIAEQYEEISENSLIKEKGVSKDVCIGPRNANDTTKDGSSECKMVMKDQLYSLLSAYDILYASLSKDCIKTTDESCSNYNFLTVNSGGWTMTPSPENTYMAYKINNGLYAEKIEKTGSFSYVFYLSNRVKYESGTGTASDPYILK